MDGEGDATPVVLGVGAALAALGILIVALRFYVRYKKRAGFGWDDWLILASLLLAIVTDILLVYATILSPSEIDAEVIPGPNDDPDILNPPDVIEYNKFSFVATTLYFSITATTKLSILLLYSRLFSVGQTFRRQIIVLSVLVTGYWFGSTIANTLNCIPIRYIWINSTSDPRYCYDYNIFWFATGVLEAFIDTMILLLPIGVIVRLRLSTKNKIATGSVFITGGFVIISGILKTVYGYDPGSRVPAFENTRLWSTLHSGTGIVCACLPVCWPLFVRLGKFGSWTWLDSITSKRRRYS